jgi:ribonuclease P protein component
MAPTKSARLKHRREFLAVAARGRKAALPGVVLQWLDRGDNLPARFGFTTTKKIGNAVVRNRARRRLRAAIMEVVRETPVLGADLVLIGRNDTAKRDFVALLGDVRAAIAKLGRKS